MKINVGSKNETKVGAVQKTFGQYKRFSGAEVVGVDVNVEEFGHPKNIDECVQGAVARAKNAFRDCEYSVGIEGGLMVVPQSLTGHMEVAVCAIYDGKRMHLGLSSAFEWPVAVTDGILNKGLDGSQALRQAGITAHEKIGAAQGGIYILTDGRLDRTAYNSEAVRNALIQIEFPQYY